MWFAGGSSSKALLTTYGLETLLHYSKISGNTNAAILSRASFEVGLPKEGLCVLFKLKKQITSQNVYQAACQLVLASLSSDFRPIVVLSDLRDDWRIFWLDQRTMWVGKLAGRGAALSVIQGCVDAAAAQVSEGRSTPKNTALTMPPVLANRESQILRKAAGVVIDSVDAPLLSLVDQLPPEEAREVYAQVMLHRLSLQPSFCGLADVNAETMPYFS
jgi:hypothetical protein